MSWALNRTWARANIGIRNRGVPMYKIRSRQLLRIHGVFFGAFTGTAGTTCGCEKALTCCISCQPVDSLISGKIATLGDRLWVELLTGPFSRVRRPHDWLCLILLDLPF